MIPINEKMLEMRYEGGILSLSVKFRIF